MDFTVGAVPMLMFNPNEKDTISPSSIIGDVATCSTNKTWFLMGFGMFFFDEDNWRIPITRMSSTCNFFRYSGSDLQLGPNDR